MQSSVHIVNVIEICAPIGFGQRCVESVVEHDQRQSTISKCDTQTPELVLSKLCDRDHSSLVPQRLVSHRNACELSHMKAMVQMVDKGMRVHIVIVREICARIWFS